ncbi:hypothetical protein GA0070622_2799 [Micromonospora sediminicola]|uniref:DUF2938 domain-containing protein n=1 Tax=Micromonospora sediminicola TaxID=946078 RepID=A0A1A9B9H0_9ACTN|nr:hypothetical protein [Micromonospora sediminicola]SBT65788.1 hypothetical protein GA0070622_2799 [Micromonospora sediminicola]
MDGSTGMWGRAVVSGLAGTVVMTAFQRLVEMPLTGRGDSFAPANLVERVLPVPETGERGRRGLNWVAHFALGGMWGAAFAAALAAGVRRQRAVHAVFAVVYVGDVVLNTALGLYQPRRWSAQDWAVDLVDKYVQAQATGLILGRISGARR